MNLNVFFSKSLGKWFCRCWKKKMFLITNGKWKLEPKNLILLLQFSFVLILLFKLGKCSWHEREKRRTMNRSNDTLSHEEEAIAGKKLQDWKWKSRAFVMMISLSVETRDWVNLTSLQMRDEWKCEEIVKSLFLLKSSSSALILSSASGDLFTSHWRVKIKRRVDWISIEVNGWMYSWKKWGREDPEKKMRQFWTCKWIETMNGLRQKRFFFTLFKFVLFLYKTRWWWSKTDDRVMHWVQEVRWSFCSWSEERAFLCFPCCKCLKVYCTLWDDEIEDGNVG